LAVQDSTNVLIKYFFNFLVFGFFFGNFLLFHNFFRLFDSKSEKEKENLKINEKKPKKKSIKKKSNCNFVMLSFWK